MEKKHSDVITRFQNCDSVLRKNGLMIKNWGRLAIVTIEDPHRTYIINNIDSMEEIEQFVNGFLYAKFGKTMTK